MMRSVIRASVCLVLITSWQLAPGHAAPAASIPAIYPQDRPALQRLIALQITALGHTAPSWRRPTGPVHTLAMYEQRKTLNRAAVVLLAYPKQRQASRCQGVDAFTAVYAPHTTWLGHPLHVGDWTIAEDVGYVFCLTPQAPFYANCAGDAGYNVSMLWILTLPSVRTVRILHANGDQIRASVPHRFYFKPDPCRNPTVQGLNAHGRVVYTQKL